MSSESEKGKEEIRAFHDFIERARISIDPKSVEKRPVGEPDLLCKHKSEGIVAFELVRIVNDDVAKVLAAGPRATSVAFSTADNSVEIVRTKLKKTYKSSHPIELLVYTDGRLITPDDVIIPTISPLFDAIKNPFRRAWFMGEKETLVVWQVS